MSVTVRYVGSSGNSYDLKTSGLRLKDANFHSYSWTPDTTERQYGVKLTRFKKKALTYKTTLAFFGTHDERKEEIEALHVDFETDILNESPGRIYWGKGYIECYIISSSTAPDDKGRWTENDVSIYCPYPYWIEETSLEIGAVSAGSGTVIDTDKGYTDSRYAYDYSYAASQTIKHIVLDHYGLASYKLVASGPAEYVAVTIDGVMRRVNYSISKGETLTIDTRPNLASDQRIYVTRSDGTTVNVFDYRDGSGIFTKISPGTLSVDYSRSYPITLVLYAERSEPRNG